MNSKFIDLYQEHLIRTSKTESTRIAYLNDIKQFSNYLDENKVGNVRTEDVKGFLQYLLDNDYSKKTSSRKLNSIRSFYKFLTGHNHAKIDPSKNVSYPKSTAKKQRILTESEFRKLIDVCRKNKRLYTIIMLLLQTGIRIGELARLTVSDITLDMENPKLLIREYSSIGEREVPLTDKVLFILKDYLFEHEHAKEKDFPLFYTSKNKPMRIRNIRSAVNRAFNNAKIPEICVNDLRNTFIVKQLEYGNTLEFVASLVGHKTILTTERYLRLLSKKYQPNTINKVAEI